MLDGTVIYSRGRCRLYTAQLGTHTNKGPKFFHVITLCGACVLRGPS